MRTTACPLTCPDILAFPNPHHRILKLTPPSSLPVMDAAGALPTFSWVAPLQGTQTWLSMTGICIPLPYAFSGYQYSLSNEYHHHHPHSLQPMTDQSRYKDISRLPSHAGGNRPRVTPCVVSNVPSRIKPIVATCLTQFD